MTEVQHPYDRPKPRRRGCAGIFFFLFLIIGSLWGAGLGVFVWILDDAKTTIEALEDFRPKVGSKVFSWDGELLGEFTIEQRRLVRLNEMPLHLQKAFVATEDDKFFEHKGVRVDAIVKAALDALRTGHTRGGSGITQQVVRNIEPLQVGQERTIQRKIREAFVAFQVEREFTKDEILELYLNQIFLGISAHGVEAAAQQYFAKSCRDVTLGEAAMLAGLTRRPNRQEPFHYMKNALTRRNIVLQQMLENRFITEAEYEAALQEDLDAAVVTPEERQALREEGKAPEDLRAFKAPYFVEEIRQFLMQQYGKSEVFENGLEIRTTLDLQLQTYAEQALLKALDEFDEKKKAYLERNHREDEFIPVSGALVCIDNRDLYKGFVRALVGGRDFQNEKYNTATQAKRQPGSSVKPFVWTAAVDNGLTPSTVIFDEPFERIAPNGQPWRPKNFDGKFHGPMTIRHALEKSVNIVAIKLAEMLGPPLVRSYFERCGLPADVTGLTIALGTQEVTVLDHCVAYSCFPNGGVRYSPVMVADIFNRDGLPRYNYKVYQGKEQALDPKVAYVVTHMLQGVCTPDFTMRTPEYPTGYYPTGWRTHVLKRPCGGKTGTTNSSRNVWFCGFTREFTTIVWIGYRDNRPLGKGGNFTGGRLAAPVWVEFMQAAHEGLPVRDFEVPYGVDFYDIHRFKGTLGGDYKEAYIAGTKPPEKWLYDDYKDLDVSDDSLLEEF